MNRITSYNVCYTKLLRALAIVLIALSCPGCGTAMYDLPGWTLQAKTLDTEIEAAKTRLATLQAEQARERADLDAGKPDDGLYDAMSAQIAALSALISKGSSARDTLNEQIAEAELASLNAQKGVGDKLVEFGGPYGLLMAGLIPFVAQLIRQRGQQAATKQASEDADKTLDNLIASVQPLVDALDPEGKLALSKRNNFV